MNYKELLQFLEIENGNEFEYFENIADLFESEQDIEEEALYKLFNEVDYMAIIEIIENYFEDIMNALPDDSTEIYTLFETIKITLIGLLQSLEEEVALVHLCEEILRFRTWYSVLQSVECKNISTGETFSVSIRDALSLARIEKLEGDKYQYDFEECMDYKIEEYIMSYGDMARANMKEIDDAMEDEEYDQYEG